MSFNSDFKCKSWEHFLEQAASLADNSRERQARDPYSYVSSPLFRGHRQSTWRLETTLERYIRRESIRADIYDRIIQTSLPVIQTMTERFRDLKFADSGCTPEVLRSAEGVRRLEYMVFLRHLGFPSPLLDWTRSPFIASFFAYRESGSEEVAIYAFREDLGEGKGGWAGKGMIQGIDPAIQTHRRHVLQQCEYTWCVSHIPENPHFYVPHEYAIAHVQDDQDELTKFILPARERERVLSQLDQMNINAFSLFENDEGLMETLANRHLTEF